jgi:nucleolar MIF4G domain-containing protein 1
MLEAFADLKNNKSRRSQNANAEVVKSLRRWLGTIKNSSVGGRGTNHQCMRVTLADLIDADKKGRWWRAGASWAGNQAAGPKSTAAGDDGADAAGKKPAPSKRRAATEEEERLLVLAKKMRFNTSTRQNIFVVVASSRDVDDAFERLQRLGLEGKQDREVLRVISECCAQEKVYNPFYAELASLLCAHQRQYKTTMQFIFWDHFKVIADDDGNTTTTPSRRVLNLARLLAHLVGGFHLPLAVLKPIDTTDLNASMILFLATFWMSLFSSTISDDSYQNLLDRVAHTTDFATVRDNTLMFLQTHLTQVPPTMRKRRTKALTTMREMSVLDVSRGLES